VGREAQSNMRLLRGAMGGEVLPFGTYVNGCPKCMAKQHGTLYCVGVMTNPECEKDFPHLHRACGNCQFMWSERSLDDLQTPEIVKFRANPETVLAIILSGVGGVARFSKSIQVQGMVVAEELPGGVIEVRLVQEAQQ